MVEITDYCETEVTGTILNTGGDFAAQKTYETGAQSLRCGDSWIPVVSEEITIGTERWTLSAYLTKYPDVSPPANYNTWVYKSGSGDWVEPGCGGPADCLLAYHPGYEDAECNDHSDGFHVYSSCRYDKWGC